MTNTSPYLLHDLDRLAESLEIKQVGHLPIVTAFCDRLNLEGIINSLVPSQMETAPGLVVKAMVLDTLSGRSPLYRLHEFLDNTDSELLLGNKVNPADFNDTNIGRTLDKIYEAGTSKIFGAFACEAARMFELDMKHLHFDTTSNNVHGVYLNDEKPDDDSSNASNKKPPIKIEHGYSKDHRPDLKQFILDALCVEKNIPIFSSIHDGSKSDKIISNVMLCDITRIMKKQGLQSGAFVVIADSALVTEKNLKAMGDNLFITRLPANYAACASVIEEAVAQNDWQDVGALAASKPTPKRPVAQYRLHESTISLYDKTYRAIVVHSSAHDRRRQKRLEREIKKDAAALNDAIKQASKPLFYCQKDAEQARSELEKQQGCLHNIEVRVVQRPKYKRGRPRKNEVRQVAAMRYGLEATLAQNEAAIEKAKRISGCFVLLTNVPKEGEMEHDSKEVLAAYKEQHGIERNFSFLKDPVLVNSLFLKSPARIEVLGMILIIALLVWNLIERALRQYIEETQERLPGWRTGGTNKPTTFMISVRFKYIAIAFLGGKRMTCQFNDVQKAFLKALDITPEQFYTPNPAKPRAG